MADVEADADASKKVKKIKKVSASSSKTTKKSSKDKKQSTPSQTALPASGADAADSPTDSPTDVKKVKKVEKVGKDKKKKASIVVVSSDDKDGDLAVAPTTGDDTDVGKVEQQGGKSPKKKPSRVTKSKLVDGNVQSDKLQEEPAKQIADNDVEVEEEEVCVLKPIPPPNNPPSEHKITLILKRPDLEKLKMTRVDPANTNIRMVREFLQKEYYKNHDIPRHEQQKLLYRLKPIFDETMDPYIDDAKTLADHGIIQDNAVIELSKMHVHVISPSTQKSMMINNIDPMNDVIFDMKKLALEDGYPIDGLRLLHKEAGDREIKQDKNQATFFDCGVKHEHTLILEWPKIVLKVKLPLASGGINDAADVHEMTADRQRKFELVDLLVQAELDTVNKIHEFILERTGIPLEAQSLLWNPVGKTKGKKKSQSMTPQKLDVPKKILADYKVQENDIIELEPMTVKINLISAGGAANPTMVLEEIYPHDTIGYIKDRIELGGRFGKDGDRDGDFPSILKTNQSLFKHNNGKELRRDQQTLLDAGVTNGDELDVEKTKITIKVRLPESKSGSSNGKGSRVVEIGVNPKLDDVETIKDLLADMTGLPKEFFPGLSFGGSRMDGNGSKAKTKLVEYGMADNDVIDMEPMTLYVNVTRGGKDEKVCIEGIDPFNDTVQDIKDRLGPEGLNLLPVDRQRLRFMDTDLDEGNSNEKSPTSHSPKLFECNIKHMDAIDLEKSKIDITIKQPNGKGIELKSVDPRKDNLECIRKFVSDEYYHGKDRDGSIPENQLRPLKLAGKTMKDPTKSVRDYGIVDDGIILQLEPMMVRVIVGSTDDDADGGQTIILDDVDPMNDNIHEVKHRATGGTTPPEMFVLLHKESQMKEIEDGSGKASTFYDCGVNYGDTLIVRRKPATIRVKLPADSRIRDENHPDVLCGNVKVIYDDEGGTPVIAIRVNPDVADFDAVRKHILDHVGVPIVAQRLNKVAEDCSDVEAPKKSRIDVPGGTKLSAPELNLCDGCTIELEPMIVNVKTERGKVVSVPILPSDTVEDFKKKLAEGNKARIPFDRQRLLTEGGTELGGDEHNENSIGNPHSTLLELGVCDGDTLTVEKCKILLKVKMPHGMDDVEVLVDPKNGTVDQIRESIFAATGLLKQYQQRLKLADGQLLDDGYLSNGDGNDTVQRSPTNLAKFELKESACVTLEPSRLFVLKFPEKQQFVIADIDLMRGTILDLKKCVAAETRMPTYKQCLLNSKTDKEYGGEGDSNETPLLGYGLQDGDWVHLEKNRIEFRIILPALNELELTVDPRRDDLQKIRDHVFKKYYNERIVPKKDLRPMLVRSHIVLDEEPGERKLIEFGIRKDRDNVKLSPSTLTIDTPRRVIFCPNADIFHDTLATITELVEREGIKTKGLNLEFNGKKMTDFKAVLYDLNITDGSTLSFVA